LLKFSYSLIIISVSCPSLSKSREHNHDQCTVYKLYTLEELTSHCQAIRNCNHTYTAGWMLWWPGAVIHISWYLLIKPLLERWI